MRNPGQVLRPGEVGFDARRGFCHAAVDLERGGRIGRYPCEIHAPPAWTRCGRNAPTRAALAFPTADTTGGSCIEVGFAGMAGGAGMG